MMKEECLCVKLPAYKRRRVYLAYQRAKDEISKRIPSANATKYYVRCNFSDSTVELTKGREYLLCAFTSDSLQQSEPELRKLKSYNWTIVKRALNLSEAEIVWKFRHDALLSPSLAFHMGLSSSKQCCMCKQGCTGVNHYLARAKTLFHVKKPKIKCACPC